MNIDKTLIAPLIINDVEVCMAMISHNVFHLFDGKGNNLNREDFKLPDIIVLLFEDKDIRQFTLVNPNTETDQGCIYVINENNELIFSSTDSLESKYCRLAENSILLGCSKLETGKSCLATDKCHGMLIWNGQLTNCKFVGLIEPYYLFKDSNIYKLFAIDKEFEPDKEANKYKFDSDDWEYKLKSEKLIHVQDFETDFVILWKTNGSTMSFCRLNVIYPKKANSHILELISYSGTYYDYDSIIRSFHIDSNLSSIEWIRDIQILTDDRSILMHHTNISSDYNGFTIVIDYNGYEYQFELTNQKRLGKYYNDSIDRYSNSLILFSDSYGYTIYNKRGEIVIKTDNGYDYQRRRAAITEYAIFGRNLGSPWINANIYNNHTRYGVLKIENLLPIIPSNYNKIDFMVLEESSSKHYREPGEYEIFIKTCIECLDEKSDAVEYWGLFKDSKLLLPCAYLEIELCRVKHFYFILLTDSNKRKGIFYKDSLIIPTIYIDITIFGNYLILERPNKTFDILYIYAPDVIVCQCDSFYYAAIKLEFLKEEYKSEDSIIISTNGHYGLVDHGEVICECIYDEISIENVSPNHSFSYSKNTGLTNPIWYKIKLGDKWGIYSNYGNRTEKVLSEIIYSKVQVIDWKITNTYLNYNPSREFVLVLDDSFYTKNLIPFSVRNDMVFRGFLSGNILVFSNPKGDSVEFFTCAGKKKDHYIVNSDGYFVDENDEEYSDIKSLYALCYTSCLKYPSNTDEEYVFSFRENKIIQSPFFKNEDEEDEDEEDDYDYDTDDNYDYERDTYYALGGDDYDAFRENGGSIDDMMDGMGF